MFSIDQNCHSLWDALPKCQAVARKGHSVRHFIEDIDVAFAAVGCAPEGPLHFAMERFYGSGGADWGAALFYSDFLGRQPADIRTWEAYTGMTTAALARRLDATVDELYDRYSPGDNWQLIGPSYAGDRDHHRLIADLSVAELHDLLIEMMDRADQDLRNRFPSADAQQRITDWFAAERTGLQELMARHSAGRLPALYHDWMNGYLAAEPGVELARASELFALGADPAATGLLDLFVNRYDDAAAIYNQAMVDSQTGLHELDTQAGELPFFATVDHAGHHARTQVFLDDGVLRIGDRDFPLAKGHLPIDAMKVAGIGALAGKAALLILQARISDGGTGLVLPFHGSSYMPAAHALHRGLREAGLLTYPLGPLMRVRFYLLDRLVELDTPIALPAHLVSAFGCSELPASTLARTWQEVATEAAARLDQFTTEPGRHAWQREALTSTFGRIDLLHDQRRDLAKIDPKSPELRELSHRARQLETDLIQRTLDQVALDCQVAQIDFWDSRGAILPWCVAAGGQAFYDAVVARAELYEETPGCPQS